MELGITNRVALITGAGRGVGREAAIQLAAEGARVFAVSRSQGPLDTLLADLESLGANHRTLALDLMQSGAADAIANWMGAQNATPDIIVHNAGGSLGVSDAMAPAADWERVWRFNLGVGVDINRALAGAMIERKWGRIVHLSSRAAKTGVGNPAYVSAKAALDGYVRAFGHAVARHNVIVSAVAPGAIEVEGRYFSRMKTENPAKLEEFFDHHVAIRRLASAAEIAASILFLCSEKASYAAGSIFPVDGGNT